MSNETTIKITKAKKRADLFDRSGDGPICNTGEFHGIHLDLVFRDYHAKVFNLFDVESAFVEVKEKVVVFEFL